MAGAESVRLAIPHAEALEEAQWLGEQLEAALNCVEIHVVDLASSLTVHGGSGLVSVDAYGETLTVDAAWIPDAEAERWGE